MRFLRILILLSPLLVNSVNGKTFGEEITEFSFMLQPSTAPWGIGIFAAHKISTGAIIHFFPDGYEPRILHKKDIPEDFLKYCTAQSDDEWKCPHRFDHMEIVWYINHANSPNLKRIGRGKFIVIRDIKKGEEVTMDYNELGEPEHLKQDYYKRDADL